VLDDQAARGVRERHRGPAGCLTIAGLLAAAALAQAQTQTPIEIDVDAKVIPNKAGTPSDPQPVRLKVHAELVSELGYERPIMTGGRVLFPRAGNWNGAKHPSCELNTLNRNGVAACPKGSILGKGVAKAWADTEITRPRITVVNGGAKRVYFFTVLTNPARVATAVVGKIKELRSGPWKYRLDYSVPESLQVVAGVPITVTELDITAGKGDYLVTTSCPKSGRWPYKAWVYLDDGRKPLITGSTPCRR
jgi:hypothetical protein